VCVCVRARARACVHVLNRKLSDYNDNDLLFSVFKTDGNYSAYYIKNNVQINRNLQIKAMLKVTGNSI
jgi:hypothetical protein